MRLTDYLFSIMRVFLLLSIVAFFAQVQALTYIAPPVIEPKACDISVEKCVEWFSKEYDVSYEMMMNVMRCENRDLDPTLQSKIKYSFTNEKLGIYKGERELSYGVSQIHLPSHPNITLEQATDVTFSVEFMAKNFAKGRHSMWSCYTRLYK